MPFHVLPDSNDEILTTRPHPSDVAAFTVRCWGAESWFRLVMTELSPKALGLASPLITSMIFCFRS